jgi:hypothetical protein
MSPQANLYVRADELNQGEGFYPLRAYICASCFLMQLEQLLSAEDIIREFSDSSSYSSPSQGQVQDYVKMATKRFGLTSNSLVAEFDSNDACLLQHFLARGIQVLVIEPETHVAEAITRQGIPTIGEFCKEATVRGLVAKGVQVDLLVANNVLTHVSAINDFVEALKLFLKPRGVITLEFPHLLRLLEKNQFDTIYHEHFTYFSLLSAERVLAAHGLRVFDFEELPIYGGYLRLHACHSGNPSHTPSPRIDALRRREEEAGLNRLETYCCFAEKVKESKRRLLEFLIGAKRQGKSIVGYGALASGNTLLNYCGVRSDFLDYTVDRSHQKQGYFLPGTRIPILPPGQIVRSRPDYLLILPCDRKEEITAEMSSIREWGGKFVLPLPDVAVF